MGKEVNTKKIYFWNMMGTLVYSASSMLFLMLVTRLTSPADADNFSIAYSIGQLLATIGMFQVRNYQATDILEKYEFKDYFMFRIITNIFMVISIGVYCYVKRYTGEKLLLVWIICLYKSVETFSDVAQGLFQQKERLDLAGKVIVYRTIISMGLFMLVAAVTGSVLAASTTLLISAIVCILIFDWRWIKNFTVCKILKSDWLNKKDRFVQLFLTCLPLFINGFLIMYIYNAPKDAIDQAIAAGYLADGSQRDFNILFMPSSVLNLFMIFLRPLITGLAISWAGKKYKDFYKSIGFIITGMAIFMLIVLFGGYLLGIPILSIVFGSDLTLYKKELMVLLLAGGLSSFATVFDNIITVIRKQHLLVISYIASTITTLIFTKTFVFDRGLIGASWSFLISLLVLFIGNLMIFAGGIISERKK